MPAETLVVMVPAATPAIILAAMALLTPIKPEDVPITIGSRAPIGPMG